MAKTGIGGLQRVINATGYSIKGLKAAFKHEAAFRQETLLALAMIAVALCFDVTVVERLLLIVPVVLVLIVELCNSAIEAVVDRFGDEYHELSGRAKDIGSAAVFLSLVLVFICWVSILFF